MLPTLCALLGIDPRARAAAYPALDVREGRFFEPVEKGIPLNRGVAKKLGVGVGGTVVALGTTRCRPLRTPSAAQRTRPRVGLACTARRTVVPARSYRPFRPPQ